MLRPILVPRVHDASDLRQGSRALASSSGFVQHRKSAIRGLPVKSDKSDWLRIWNDYSAHAQKIWCGPELSIPVAGQNDRGLWVREWLRPRHPRAVPRPLILVPRPRRLRDEKSAMGTRMSRRLLGAVPFWLEKPVRIFRQMEQYNFSSRKSGTGAAVPFDNVYFFPGRM